MGVAERIKRTGSFDVDSFMAFIEHRPDEERWQLVDGVAQRMTPPTQMHQTIASNMVFLLEDCFRRNRLALKALSPSGLRLPDVRNFHPEPDLLVRPSGVARDRWAETFLLVGEILSRSNDLEEMARKVELYCSHPDNRHVLVIDQDTIRVTHRAQANDWRPVELGEADRLALSEFSFDAPVIDLYHGTDFLEGD